MEDDRRAGFYIDDNGKLGCMIGGDSIEISREDAAVAASINTSEALREIATAIHRLAENVQEVGLRLDPGVALMD